MKTVLQESVVKHLPVLLCIAILSVNTVQAQTCPPSVSTTITSNPNTYYPAQQATVSAGNTSIAIGVATYGTTPISAGDVLLIIQMQGAQIISADNLNYGDGRSAIGYLSNAELYAGNMEYVVATNSVPLTGGTLTLQTGTVNNYKNAAFGTDGQYTYQVIRVPVYYNLILDADITAPAWDGATGGVFVLAVKNNLDMNGDTINVTGAGFRGGGGVQLGGTGITSTLPIVTVSPADGITTAFHASKGEGIAGTPRLINSNNYGSLRRNTQEGYPGGSFGMGAPGNAGGGGTNDQQPLNRNNSGGGGGGNGGMGGYGGNSYGTNMPYGGYPGAPFAQRSAFRLVMGGGGGAGDSNDGSGTPGGGLASSGAPGGGIVIISADAIINSGVILANGSNGNTTVRNDAAGGGGAGGSVFINARSGHSNLTVYANGGNGGNNFDRGRHGPGGGGGGGVIVTDGTLNATSSVTGGTAGTTNNGSSPITYGAQPGAAGVSVTGPVMAFPPGCTALPMEFLLVKGKRNGTQTLINWEVVNEKDVTNYIIERSNNGTGFVTAGIVSKRGNDEMGRYNYSEASTGTEATVFYRIKARGTNGQTFLSKVITIQTGFSEGALEIGPVPAIGHVTLRWPSTGIYKLQVTVFDVTGHAVLSRQYQLKTGLNELRLTNLQSLPNGVYFVKASDGASYRNGKLVIHN